jgi:hypothetical protein
MRVLPLVQPDEDLLYVYLCFLLIFMFAVEIRELSLTSTN